MNEGEILFINSDPQFGSAVNILTDMYVNRLEDEVTKLLKKKEKIETYSDVTFNLEKAKDWRGNTITKVINGY